MRNRYLQNASGLELVKTYADDTQSIKPYGVFGDVARETNVRGIAMQMTDVWHLPAIARWEKSCGKHPTQKPLSLLVRILLASTQPGAWVLDPFSGSSTTGIAANLVGCKFLGMEKELPYLEISRARKEEIENAETYACYSSKIPDLRSSEEHQNSLD